MSTIVKLGCAICGGVAAGVRKTGGNRGRNFQPAAPPD